MAEVTFNVAETVQACAALAGAIFAGLAYMKAHAAAIAGRQNGEAIAEVKHLTNSLSEKAQELARAVGVAEGNLTGRRDQTEERRIEATSNGHKTIVDVAEIMVHAPTATVETAKVVVRKKPKPRSKAK